MICLRIFISYHIFTSVFTFVIGDVLRFGVFLGLAHAAMTAEGDNSVLMQKVTKEHMSLFKPHKLNKPDQLDMENVHHLLYLFRARENQQHASLKVSFGQAIFGTLYHQLNSTRVARF